MSAPARTAEAGSETNWRSEATKSAAADRPGRVFWSIARKYGKAERPQGTLGAEPLTRRTLGAEPLIRQGSCEAALPERRSKKVSRNWLTFNCFVDQTLQSSNLRFLEGLLLFQKFIDELWGNTYLIVMLALIHIFIVESLNTFVWVIPILLGINQLLWLSLLHIMHRYDKGRLFWVLRDF